MLRYNILFLMLLLSISQVFAQKEPIKLGEIDEADVKMTQHPQFPDAEAVVLCDYGSVHYDLNTVSDKVVYKYIMRIKVLKKTGYERANKTIYYETYGHDRKEMISSIKGYTYNYEGGKVVKTKLEKSAITEKMVSKNVRQIKFSLPNVKEGSVIEYSYEVLSDFLWNIPTWYFQTDLPVVWSEYRVKIPQYFDFVQLGQVYKDYHIVENKVNTGTAAGSTTRFDVAEHRWVLTNLPAFKNEAFIASANNHLMKMEFQLSGTRYPNQPYKPRMESWSKLIQDMLANEKHGRYIKKATPDKEALTILVASKNTEKEKVLAVYEFVKGKVKHNGQTGIYTRKSPKEVWDKKVGNAAEINLLLVNMLQELKIKASPVLLSTRAHGKIFQQYPILDKFNYVVVYVEMDGGKEDILLDATDPMLTAGMISYQALNGMGLLLQESTQPQWINLQAAKNAKMSNIITANIAMDAAGVVQGEVSERFGGYEAIRVRRKLLKDKFIAKEEDEEGSSEEKEEDDDKEKKEEKNQFTYKNLEELNKPLDGVKKVSTTEFSQVNDDFIYFSPLLEYRMKENPFKSADRQFPVDYACPTEKAFYINFTIPEGYKVEELPKPTRLKWQDESVKFDYLVTNTENKVQLVCKFSITRPIFLPEEYKALRDLYTQIVTKQEEQIVLKKK